MSSSDYYDKDNRGLQKQNSPERDAAVSNAGQGRLLLPDSKTGCALAVLSTWILLTRLHAMKMKTQKKEEISGLCPIQTNANVLF